MAGLGGGDDKPVAMANTEVAEAYVKISVVPDETGIKQWFAPRL